MEDYPARTRYQGDVAASYDQKRRSDRDGIRRWESESEVLAKVLSRVPRDSSVLDLPCGTGRFFPLLQEMGLRTVGADISDEMLRQIPAEYLKGENPVRTVIADAEKLQFPDNTFDYVLSMRFYNHLSLRARPKVLGELSRICRRGVIIQVRFRGPMAFLGDALRAILATVKGEARQSSETAHCDYGPRGNPRFSEFRKLAEECGLQVRETHRVWWGATLNPMKICMLTHKSSDS